MILRYPNHWVWWCSNYRDEIPRKCIKFQLRKFPLNMYSKKWYTIFVLHQPVRLPTSWELKKFNRWINSNRFPIKNKIITKIISTFNLNAYCCVHRNIYKVMFLIISKFGCVKNSQRLSKYKSSAKLNLSTYLLNIFMYWYLFFF